MCTSNYNDNDEPTKSQRKGTSELEQNICIIGYILLAIMIVAIIL